VAQQDIEASAQFTIEILYGDHEGGQRTISRFRHGPVDGGGGDALVSGGVAALEPGPARPGPR